MSPAATFMPARIAEIQQRFAPTPAAPSSQSARSAFESALASAVGANGSDPMALLGLSNASGIQSPTTASILGLRNASSTGPTGNDVVATANKYLGIPYQWGGTNPETGLDCSGLVQLVYRELGIELPRVSRDQARQGTEIASIEEAKPGDLLAFGSPVDHIGIYVGDNKMLHAPRTGDVVKVGEIYRPIATIRRIVGDETSTAVASAVAAYGASAATPGTSVNSGTSVTGIAGAEPYDQLFVAAAERYGFSPKLLAAIAKTESNFNPNAVSSAGATGLMQFMPATARGMGIDPSDPAQAIDGAARYLRQQYDRFGSIELALAAYNAGPGNVAKHGGIPPFTETRNYVTKVTGLLGGQSAMATRLAV